MTDVQDFEQLGALYIGRNEAGPVLYDSRDLTTHALCVGMTGSGKTGLCLGLLEELAIDGVPAIAIDPKGDLGNLLLNFPALRAEDFRPWVDEAEAARAGLSSEAHAAQIAQRWREGLAASGQDGARIARLRAAADVALYTPGSTAGLPLSILTSLAAPPAVILDDPELLRERVTAAAASLLALLGVDSDPNTGREHILLCRLAEQAWRAGQNLDLAQLIRGIQTPPFARVGVLDVESFYPAKDRNALALRLNGLLASSSFEAWMQGEPLDVQRLLYTAEGRPRLSILSVAHLSESERMFFVTLLLHEVVAWMRQQPGTSSLRAVLFMDEVFGFFPPVANPPSKAPMLTLLKQARAYGLGIVLATQNPVDLDYKGLGNCGTWFLGRLQTERDRLRVLDGLESAASSTGRGLDRAQADALLAGLAKRQFLMHNVHEEAPVLFETRFTLSYLRGPLTRPQIKTLTETRKAGAAPAAPAHAAPAPPAAPAPAAHHSPAHSTGPAPAAAGAPRTPAAAPGSARPLAPAGIEEVFVLPGTQALTSTSGTWLPRAFAQGKLHYVDSKCALDTWRPVTLLAPFAEGSGLAVEWEHGVRLAEGTYALTPEPRAISEWGELPAAGSLAKAWASHRKSLAETLYRSQPLSLQRAPSLKLVSRPGESRGDFMARVAQARRERRDEALAKLQQRYSPKLRTCQDKLARAEERVRREEAQFGQRKLETTVSFGTTLLGALFGRKLASSTNVGRAGTTLRGMSRAAREKEDVAAARQVVAAESARLAELEAELQQQVSALTAELAQEPPIETVEIAPRKADIVIESLRLAWVPAGASFAAAS